MLPKYSRVFAASLLALVWGLLAPQAYAFTDGSGYQILLAMQSSVSELKKQYQELKKSTKSLQDINHLNQIKEQVKVKSSSLQFPRNAQQLDELWQPIDEFYQQVDQLPGNVKLPDLSKYKNQIHRLVEALQKLQKMKKSFDRDQLISIAEDRIKRKHQESLIENYSLPERQSRDLQTELLLELVNRERDRQQREYQLRLRAQRFERDLRRFLY